MNRKRLLITGTILGLLLAVIASPGIATDSPQGVPTVEGHLKMLSAKLDLTADQQDKVKPILQELHDATVKLTQNENMSQKDCLSKLRAAREQADKSIRTILSEEQKKKLDQFESEPHPELHGNMNGAKN